MTNKDGEKTILEIKEDNFLEVNKISLIILSDIKILCI